MSLVDVLLLVVVCALLMALVAWDMVGGREITRRIRRTGDEMRRQNEERDAS